MKKFTVTLFTTLFMFSITLFAEQAPDYMKDGTITVTLKNGQSYSFSTNEYKVVRRGAVNLMAIHADVLHERVVELSKHQQKLNRIRVLGGQGPSSTLDINSQPTVVTVKTRYENVFGLGYDRMLSEKWSVGGQALSNGTLLLNVGLDY